MSAGKVVIWQVIVTISQPPIKAVGTKIPKMPVKAVIILIPILVSGDLKTTSSIPPHRTKSPIPISACPDQKHFIGTVPPAAVSITFEQVRKMQTGTSAVNNPKTATAIPDNSLFFMIIAS